MADAETKLTAALRDGLASQYNVENVKEGEKFTHVDIIWDNFSLKMLNIFSQINTIRKGANLNKDSQ